MKAIGRVLLRRARIDRGAIVNVPMRRARKGRAPIGRVPMRRAPIDRGAIVNVRRMPRAESRWAIKLRETETAMHRDGNLEKANAPIRSLVIAKPPAIAKNKLFGDLNIASADRLTPASPVHFSFRSVKTGASRIVAVRSANLA